MRGRQLKQLIKENINDEDIVCFGEQGDKLGRTDRKIIGVETRQIGFDSNDTYKAIVTTPYETNGAMKFWK